MPEPMRVSWLDSTGLPSHIHLTMDGEDTLCGGSREYLAHRHLVKSPNKQKGRSLYCRECFMNCGAKYDHGLPWHGSVKDNDPSAPPWWSLEFDEYMRKKYPGGFVNGDAQRARDVHGKSHQPDRA